MLVLARAALLQKQLYPFNQWHCAELMPTKLQYCVLVSDVSRHVCLTNSSSLTHLLWPSRVISHSRKPHQFLECVPAFSATTMLGTIQKVNKKAQEAKMGT